MTAHAIRTARMLTARARGVSVEESESESSPEEEDDEELHRRRHRRAARSSGGRDSDVSMSGNAVIGK
jgi:hypothetical protein